MQNVRVQVYRPHRNSKFISALIVWDAAALNSSQTQYTVNVFDNEGLLLTSDGLGLPSEVGVR